MQAVHPTSHRFETVSAYLAWDHDELDAAFDDLVPMVEDGEWERAEDHVAEFVQRLERHIDIEESVLFPVFEERVAADGPTRVMRIEHARIKRALGMLQRAVQRHDAAEFAAGRRELDDILPDHNLKEERILYPAIDRALGEEAAAVLDRVLPR